MNFKKHDTHKKNTRTHTHTHLINTYKFGATLGLKNVCKSNELLKISQYDLRAYYYYH